MNGKPIRVSVAKKSEKYAVGGGVAPAYGAAAAQGAAGGPTTLYVAGIPKTYTTEDLVNLFAPYGSPSDPHIMRNDDPNQKNAVAFIKLDTPSQAQTAISALHNSVPPNGTDPIVVKYKVLLHSPRLSRVDLIVFGFMTDTQAGRPVRRCCRLRCSRPRRLGWCSGWLRSGAWWNGCSRRVRGTSPLCSIRLPPAAAGSGGSCTSGRILCGTAASGSSLWGTCACMRGFK